MEFKELWRLQSSAEGKIGSVQLVTDPSGPILECGTWKLYTVQILFDYINEKKIYHDEIHFDAHQVYKYTAESFIKQQHIPLNTLVEFTGSAWLNKLKKINADLALSHPVIIRHFAIFFSGYGLYEVFAADYKILESHKGQLPE